MVAPMFFTVFFLVIWISIKHNERSPSAISAERFYYDKSGRLVDSITKNTCINLTYDLNHNGHNIIVGDDSDAVLMDCTAQKAKDDNRKLADSGMEYRWTEHKNLTSGKVKDYRSIWLPVDQITGKPYKLTKLHSMLQTNDKAYMMSYLNVPADKETIYGLLWTDESKYVSEDEAKKYLYYGPGYKNF